MHGNRAARQQRIRQLDRWRARRRVFRQVRVARIGATPRILVVDPLLQLCARGFPGLFAHRELHVEVHEAAAACEGGVGFACLIGSVEDREQEVGRPFSSRRIVGIDAMG